jgi:hypothetical protein
MSSGTILRSNGWSRRLSDAGMIWDMLRYGRIEDVLLFLMDGKREGKAGTLSLLDQHQEKSTSIT